MINEECYEIVEEWKGARVDQVAAKIIRAGEDILLRQLHVLLTYTWYLEYIQLAWEKVIVPVLKKGNNILQMIENHATKSAETL